MKAIVNPHWQFIPERMEQLTSYVDKMSNSPWFHSNEIEDLLCKINSATSPDLIPTTVVVSYGSLLQRNINPKDVVDVVNLSAKIASSRLGVKFNEIIYTGITNDKIDAKYYKLLSSGGFRGCSVSPISYGIDAAMSTVSSHIKDDWHGMVIADKSASTYEFCDLAINLTYRQHQIANLIWRRGLTNSQIAKQLGLSDSTVKMHIGIILKKYGVQHRTQLIVAMQEKTAK